jgi:hypothetical protein
LRSDFPARFLSIVERRLATFLALDEIIEQLLDTHSRHDEHCH